VRRGPSAGVQGTGLRKRRLGRADLNRPNTGQGAVPDSCMARAGDYDSALGNMHEITMIFSRSRKKYNMSTIAHLCRTG
jgi:hypothetical protein